MRTVAKILIILNVVASFLLGIAFLVSSLGVLLSLVMVVNIVIGVVALVDLGDDSKKPSIVISVLVLLTQGLLAGILMLCIPEDTPIRRPRTVGRNAKCDHCGMKHPGLQIYKVETYVGTRERCLCPLCKEKESIQ